MVAALQDITAPRHIHNEWAALKRIVTLEEFAEIAAALPEEQLELINGEIVMWLLELILDFTVLHNLVFTPVSLLKRMMCAKSLLLMYP